jgi:ribonuclease Z
MKKKTSTRSMPVVAVEPTAEIEPTVRTTLILLGTGMPRPDPMCSGPASAVVVGGQVFLFDAGPGVMRRLAAAGLPIDGVDALFLTHLHSDHTLGYPDLIFTSWVMGRREPLQAYGPKGLRRMTKHILEAWKEDIGVRITGLERASAEGYQVDVHEINPGVVYDRDGVRITAFPVRHGSWKHAYGFRIDTADRSIVISGDTRPCDTLLDAARGVDILLHEVYPDSGLVPELREGGEEWPSYMREFHTSDLELGAIAAVAQPKLLVLHHIVRMGTTDEELLEAIRTGGFTGDTVIGQDLDWF